MSVTTSSDVFGPTDVNMTIEMGGSVEVSTASHGESAETKATCLVHPASQMMRLFHFSDGTCGSRHMWPIPLPINSVDYNVTLLRADAGCTTGHNSYLSSSSCKLRARIPHIFIWLFLLVCFLLSLQTVAAILSQAPTLSVYALNANGFVSPIKIHHISNVIRSRRPHVFII